MSQSAVLDRIMHDFESVAAELPDQVVPHQARAQAAAELKRHGFTFTGPVTAYATMQACGIVNDHLAGCFVRER